MSFQTYVLCSAAQFSFMPVTAAQVPTQPIRGQAFQLNSNSGSRLLADCAVLSSVMNQSSVFLCKYLLDSTGKL